MENPNPQAQIAGSGPKKFEFKNKPTPNWLFFPTKRRAAEVKSSMADFQPRIARADLDTKHEAPDHLRVQDVGPLGRLYDAPPPRSVAWEFPAIQIEQQVPDTVEDDRGTPERSSRCVDGADQQPQQKQKPAGPALTHTHKQRESQKYI